MDTSGIAAWTAPTMTRRGRRGNASTNHWRPAASTVFERPRARASAAAARSIASASGSPVEPVMRAGVVDHDRVGRAAHPAPACAAPNSGGGASAGRRVMTALPGSWAAANAAGGHERLDEHVDGAAAREAHVPRLLVADAVADHALRCRPRGPSRPPRTRRPPRSRRSRSPRGGRRPPRAARHPPAAGRCRTSAPRRPGRWASPPRSRRRARAAAPSSGPPSGRRAVAGSGQRSEAPARSPASDARVTARASREARSWPGRNTSR